MPSRRATALGTGGHAKQAAEFAERKRGVKLYLLRAARCLDGGLTESQVRALDVEAGIVHGRGDVGIEFGGTVNGVQGNAERGHLR